MRRRAAKLTIFLALFAAGAAVAGLAATGGFALDTTTTETLTETRTETTTTTATTTAPAQTVVTTATVEHTTTREIIVPAHTTSTTSTSESSSAGTPTWVWVLLGVLAVAVAVLIIVLLTRRGGGLSAAERSRRLDAAVGSWAGQGYAVESKSAASAVVRRGYERIMISVDPSGAVSSQHLAADDWPTS